MILVRIVEFLEQGRLSVLADCNRCNGSCTLAAAGVSISGLACTRAFCQTSPFDTDYVSVLSGDSAAAVAGLALQLSSRNSAVFEVRQWAGRLTTALSRCEARRAEQQRQGGAPAH